MSPYLTHPVTALLRFGILLAILRFGFRVPGSEWLAMAYTAGLYEGREAGQREHDLKNWPQHGTDKPLSPVKAWLGSFLFYEWAPENFAQALAGIIPVVAAACAIHFLGL